MKTLGLMTSAALLAATLVAPALADSANWDADKAKQISENRTSNAGIGNGGEAKIKGHWYDPKGGEDAARDIDPGNSGDHNQACTTPKDSTPTETDC